MNSLFDLLHFENLRSLKVKSGNQNLFNQIDREAPIASSTEVNFCDEYVGQVESNLSGQDQKELAAQIASLLYLYQKEYPWEVLVNIQEWVRDAKLLVPEVADWIGIYYKANYFLDENTTDLVLGPYYGESTSHTRIPLDRGLCGLALREERVVNVADVHQDERHIACSLKTNSELIIPLKNSAGLMVAELDIDCNRLGAFSSDIEEKFKTYCDSFAKNWDKR